MHGPIHTSDIYVTMTKNRGAGVFAGRDFQAGELVEVCPVIVMEGPDERDHLDRTRLFNYYFAWGKQEEKVAIALGYGSLYNHSYCPNADHITDFSADEVRVYAYRPIRKDEEITINYAGRPECRDPVWFSVLADE